VTAFCGVPPDRQLGNLLHGGIRHAGGVCRLVRFRDDIQQCVVHPQVFLRHPDTQRSGLLAKVQVLADDGLVCWQPLANVIVVVLNFIRSAAGKTLGTEPAAAPGPPAATVLASIGRASICFGSAG